MKRIIRTFIFYLAALWLVQLVLAGSFHLSGDAKSWAVATGILALLNMLLKPILHILFFPIHALTLGFFSIVVNALVFYLFLKLVPAASIASWQFPGFISPYVTLPASQIPIIGTLFIASALISIITNFFTYLVE